VAQNAKEMLSSAVTENVCLENIFVMVKKIVPMMKTIAQVREGAILILKALRLKSLAIRNDLRHNTKENNKLQLNITS